MALTRHGICCLKSGLTPLANCAFSHTEKLGGCVPQLVYRRSRPLSSVPRGAVSCGVPSGGGVPHPTCGATWPGSGSWMGDLAPTRCPPARAFMSRASDYHSKHSEDGVETRYRIVYTSTLQRHLALTYGAVTLLTLPCVTAVGYRLAAQWVAAEGTLAPVLDLENPLLVSTAAGVLGLAVLVALRQAIVRCVLRLYYDEESNRFVAITRSTFLRPIRTHFAPSDVTDKRQDGVVTIHGQKYFFKVADFRTNYYYNIMMGFMKEDSAQKAPGAA